jgi:hypothetical protein
MLPVIEAFMAAHHLPDVTVVADAGMVSEANQKQIEAAGLSFILGMKIPRIPYVVTQWRHEHPSEDIPDGHIFTQPWPAGPNGGRLNFVASARSAFDFVTNPPYSLWLVGQDEGRVTYAGVDLGLAILHDRLSYEIDLALWRESVEAEVAHPYTMVDLLPDADPDRARSYRQFSASTEVAVERGLAILESDFRRFGVQALSGSHEFFERMRYMRSLAAAEFGSELKDKRIRERAGRA